MDNILLTQSGVVKLIGFETIGADVISSYRRKTIIPYLPPEICEKGPQTIINNSMFNYATDIWCAGVVLYIFLYGRFPFWSDNLVHFFEEVQLMQSSSSLNYPSDDVKTPQAIKLLESMLNGDPTKRPTFEECVQFEWIQQHSDEDNERNLVQASSQLISLGENISAVTPGVKLEKRKSLSQMFKSSMKDLHEKPVTPNLTMSQIDEEFDEIISEHYHSEGDILVFHNHEWRRKYFNRPSWCALCGGFIAGVTKEMQNSYKCRNCKIYGHAACLSTSNIECEGCLDDTTKSSNSS